jgi:hypothetical protein
MFLFLSRIRKIIFIQSEIMRNGKHKRIYLKKLKIKVTNDKTEKDHRESKKD